MQLMEIQTLTTALIVLLFIVVCGLLVWGAYHFSPRSAAAQLPRGVARRVDPRREVVWTGVATMVLLAIFLVAR